MNTYLRALVLCGPCYLVPLLLFAVPTRFLLRDRLLPVRMYSYLLLPLGAWFVAQRFKPYGSLTNSMVEPLIAETFTGMAFVTGSVLRRQERSAAGARFRIALIASIVFGAVGWETDFQGLEASGLGAAAIAMRRRDRPKARW